VLRFESDGTAVRDDGAGAPVFSQGYAQPTALAWSALGNELWLAGTGADWAGTLARLSLNRTSAASAVVPAGVTLAAGSAAVSLSASGSTAGPAASTAAPTALFVVAEAGGVFQVTASPGGMTATPWLAADALGGRVVAVARGSVDADVLLAVTTGVEPASMSSQIVRLRRP
jgi:hypothetical protein